MRQTGKRNLTLAERTQGKVLPNAAFRFKIGQRDVAQQGKLSQV
jgi:hypothetical protein